MYFVFFSTGLNSCSEDAACKRMFLLPESIHYHKCPS